MSSETSWNPFSPAELKLVVIVMKNLQGIPNVDWDLVAQEYGYKDGNLAKSKFTKAKGKCKGTSSPTKKAVEPKNSTPPSTLKRNKKTSGAADETPSKRPRKTAKKLKDEENSDFVKEEPTQEDEKMLLFDDNSVPENIDGDTMQG